MRHFVKFQFAALVVLAVCAGLPGKAFAVHHATLQHSHRQTFPLAALESDVPAFARIPLICRMQKSTG